MLAAAATQISKVLFNAACVQSGGTVGNLPWSCTTGLANGSRKTGPAGDWSGASQIRVLGRVALR